MEQQSAQLPAASRGRRHPYPACIGRLYEATFPDHCIEQRQCPRSQVAFVAAKAHHHSLICQYTSGQGVLFSWSINQGSVIASARSGLKDTMYFDVIIVPQLFLSRPWETQSAAGTWKTPPASYPAQLLAHDWCLSCMMRSPVTCSFNCLTGQAHKSLTP